MKKLKNIKGLTNKETVNILKQYCIDRVNDHAAERYICNYLYNNSVVWRHDAGFFVEYWAKILYPELKNDADYGFFGRPRDEQNDERIVFCLQILSEIA